MNKHINLYIKYSLTFFIVLLPAALISGPFLSDLFISLSSIIFIFYCLYFKDFKYFDNNFFKYFIIFYLLCLFSSLLSDYKLISSIKTFFYFRFGVFALAFYFALSINKNLIKYLFISLFLCFLILVLDGFFQYITGVNLIGFPKHSVRLSSFFGDEFIYGSYLSRLMPTLISLFFLSNFSKKKDSIFLFWFLIIFTVLAIFLSAERAAFFLSILSFIYLIIMLNRFSKYFLLIFFIFSSFILITVSQNNEIKLRMLDLTKTQLGLDKEKTTKISPIYKGHFLIAKDLFLSNKLIGVGPKNYRQHCSNNKKYSKPPYICTTHPHNTYIQLLAETGITGFLMIFFLFILLSFTSAKYIYFSLFKKKEILSLPKICLMSSMLITLWPFVSTGSFFNNYINIIYFFPIGIFLWLNEKTKISHNLKT